MRIVLILFLFFGGLYANDLEEELIYNSPFTRRIDNLNEDLTATGYAMVNHKPVVTLYNNKTKESHIVTNQINFDGWKLETIKEKYVIVSFRGELVRVRFQSVK